MSEKYKRIFTFNKPLIFILVFAVAGTALLLLVKADSSQFPIESEDFNRSGPITFNSDSRASGENYAQFNEPSDLSLPDPIDPGDRDFGRIVRQTAPNGGVIVLPDGDYTVSDVSNFNPSNYVVVVSENPYGARVVRTANVVGQTDQYFSNSSKLIFVGIEFKDIVTRLGGNTDIYFWQTRHSYPVTAHPVPNETFCGGGVGPNGLELGNNNRLSLYGSVIDGIGHDGIKLNGDDNVLLRGIKITKIDHQNLQQGRGNSRCGWDGDDNYHDDGIQIYPGGVNNLTLEDSYVGRQMVIQVDNGGSSNNGLVFRNNMFYQEPPNGDCLAIDARVKPGAQSGATMDMTLSGNEAWCKDSQWIFYVAGSRAGAFTINGEAVTSSQREANKYITKRSGTPNTNNTPSETWRNNNPYDNWPCYLDSEINGFNQSVTACN